MKLYFNKGIFIVIGLMGLSLQPLRRQHWTKFSWRNNVYNANFTVKTRLEYDFAIEYIYFQWL